MRFLIDENLPAAEQLFRELNGEAQQLRFFSGRTIAANELADAEVLLVRSVTQVNEALLAQAPQLKFVGTATIGTDHIDEFALLERNIGLANAAGCNAIAVGEYVLAAVLHIAEAENIALAGARALVVGAGNTGQQTAQRLAALGMQVFYYDPPRQQRGDSLAFPYTDLTELQRFAVISLHVPLTLTGSHKTQHLFAAPELHQLAANTILVNASRGPVVANEALLMRLKAPETLHVALDVWEHEPKVNAELVAAVAIATPHIAGHSIEGKLRGTFQLYQALHRYFAWSPEQWQLADILPTGLAHSAEFKFPLRQTILNQLVQQVYSVAEDDALFREQGLTPTGFDRLRKTYRLRRELSALRVKTTAEGQAVLTALGFNQTVNTAAG